MKLGSGAKQTLGWALFAALAVWVYISFFNGRAQSKATEMCDDVAVELGASAAAQLLNIAAWDQRYAIQDGEISGPVYEGAFDSRWVCVVKVYKGKVVSKRVDASG